LKVSLSLPERLIGADDQILQERKPAVELSIVLPVIGKGICLEGMLKLLTIDVAAAYELVIVASRQDIELGARERISARYPRVQWLEKTGHEGTLGALRQGIQAAGAEYILVVCADSAGPIIAINQMLKLAREGCAFVSGTRFAAGGRRLGGSYLEMSLSKLANRLLHSLAGSVFTDCTTGLKLFRKDIFEQLSLESKPEGWVIAFEMALKAQFNGLNVGEVANVAIDRLYGGDSTSHLDKEFFAYIKWFLWALSKLRDPQAKRSTMPVKCLRLME